MTLAPLSKCKFANSKINEFIECKNGATAVEFAIILLPLLFFTLGFIEAGKAYYIHHSLSLTSRELERHLMIDGTSNSETQISKKIKIWVETRVARLDHTKMKHSVQLTGQDPNKFVNITLSYPGKLLLPIVYKEYTISYSNKIPVL